MEERRASLVAVGVSSVAIGGFWMARPNVNGGSLRVLQQRNLPQTGIGVDRDAAVIFRMAIPAGFRDRERSVDFRIVDRQNHVFPVLPMSDPGFPNTLKLQRGYSHRADHPRLVAVSGSEVLGSVPIGDLPEPSFQNLTPKPSPFVSLVLQNGWIDVRPRGRFPRNERWRVSALRTQYGRLSDVWALLPNRGFRSLYPGFTLPFADEAQSVEVEITRYRLVERKTVVQIPGLLLHRAPGGVAIAVDRRRDITVPLGSMTATLSMPRQDSPPNPSRNPNPPLIARATFNISYDPEPGVVSNERREPPISVRTGLELLSPTADELGVTELHLGPTYSRNDSPPARAVKTGPFTARVLLTAWEPKEIGCFTQVVPVETEPLAVTRISPAATTRVLP